MSVATEHRHYIEKSFRLEDKVRQQLQRIEQHKNLNAFTRVYAEESLQRAKKLDQMRDAGEPTGKLAGLTIGVKDNICMRNKPVTCASAMLEDFVSPYDATVIRRIEEAGGIIIGKTNLDEFAMGSSSENSIHGTVRNPHDREKVAGGSSGGSAAAVAAGLCDLALGSDTGGSVRQPAAFCGVAGLKPTYGMVSRYGLVAFASSLDQIGCFGKTAADAGYLLAVIAGHDPRDATSSDQELSFTADQPLSLAGLKIGLPRQFFPAALDPQIQALADQYITTIEAAGAAVKSIDLPLTDQAIAVYYIIATAEASSNLSRYDGVRYGHRSRAADLNDMYRQSRTEGFGTEVKRRILLGTYVLSSGYYDAYYRKAQQVRRLIRDEYRAAFKSVDVLLTPTVPAPAFGLGERLSDPLEMYLSDIFTVTANLAGICAISIPAGKTPGGLPIGLQLMGDAFQDHKLLKIASEIENLTVETKND